MAKATLQTVDRALQLLEILAEHPKGMQPRQLEEILELNKVTVHRLLATLENRGFVERVGAGYVVGLKLVELSSMKLSSIELKTEAAPYLRELVNRLGLPVQMAIIDDQDAMFIEKIESTNSFRMYSQIGKRIPLYACGVGKALLMQKTENEIREKMKKVQFKNFTDKTIKNVEQLVREVNKAKIDGYAVDDEEHEKGIYCLAAPIFDYTGKIIAAISMGDVKAEFIKSSNSRQIDMIKEAAAMISKRLGYLKQ